MLSPHKHYPPSQAIHAQALKNSKTQADFLLKRKDKVAMGIRRQKLLVNPIQKGRELERTQMELKRSPQLIRL